MFGVAVLLRKRRPYVSSRNTGFSLLVMGKFTTQYPVNQRIVVGELVASSVATVRFGFFSVFHRLFRCRECSNRYDNINNDVKHCPTSYLLDKKRFIQIHAANLEILKE